jgi:hypothetical protein
MAGIYLDWRDIVTLASIAIALDQYRRQRNEKAATRNGRLHTLKEFVAYSFSDMAAVCTDLAAWIKIGNWDRCADLIKRLTTGLAGTSGSWAELLGSFEEDKCKAATNAIRSVQRYMPTSGQPNPDGERVVEMIRQCEDASWWLAEVAGILRYRDRPEND